MKKLIKVIIISTVLLLPVLVFLFLKQFGSNEFALPVYYEEGNPLEQCESSGDYHTVSPIFLENNSITLPALVTVEGGEPNELIADLNNVLVNYPSIETKYIKLTDQEEESQLVVLNCELVLGEDRYIDVAIYNKYVLIDHLGRIRGYFKIDELEDIERLDMELDILLNY